MNDRVSYDQLIKLSKNPFYTLNEKELAELEQYRMERYQAPKKNLNVFEKHEYTPNLHDVKLEESDDESIS